MEEALSYLDSSHMIVYYSHKDLKDLGLHEPYYNTFYQVEDLDPKFISLIDESEWKEEDSKTIFLSELNPFISTEFKDLREDPQAMVSDYPV